jgi:hypothetical protein
LKRDPHDHAEIGNPLTTTKTGILTQSRFGY